MVHAGSVAIEFLDVPMHESGKPRTTACVSSIHRTHVATFISPLFDHVSGWVLHTFSPLLDPSSHLPSRARPTTWAVPYAFADPDTDADLNCGGGFTCLYAARCQR